MKNNKGFTLMEVLLAALIVGVIGLALAALTTAAVRESGIGRTRATLRGQLSKAIAQLRRDIAQADGLSTKCNATHNNYSTLMFCLGQKGSHVLGSQEVKRNLVGYYYKKGTGGKGGWIIRAYNEDAGGYGVGSYDDWLTHVRDISSTDGSFVSPRIQIETTDCGEKEGCTVESRVHVQLIVEVPSKPVVNETVDEVFALPHGFAVNEKEGE